MVKESLHFRLDFILLVHYQSPGGEALIGDLTAVDFLVSKGKTINCCYWKYLHVITFHP